MGFIFAVHIPVGGLALLPLLTGYPLILGPVHIAFLEMIIDPVCSLVFEAETEEKDVMNRPPRIPSEALFSRRMIWWGIAQGFVTLVLVGSIFAVTLQRALPPDEVRALTFLCLVMCIIGLIFVNRSFSASLLVALRRPNPMLYLVLIGTSATLALSLKVPIVRELFRFGPIHLHDIASTVGSGVFVVVLLDLLKLAIFGRSTMSVDRT
jgi:Ca2+-transporting ATPase